MADTEGSNLAWQPRGSHSDSQESFANDDVHMLKGDFSLTSDNPSPALLQDNPHSVSHPATTTTLVISPRDVHSINIGNVGGIVSGPPPLIPAEFGQSCLSAFFKLKFYCFTAFS